MSNQGSAGGRPRGFPFELKMLFFFVLFFGGLWLLDPGSGKVVLIALPVSLLLSIPVFVIKRVGEAEAAEPERREAKARQEKQMRILTLGEKNAALLESALIAVDQVRTSEAARTGWLPDVEFSPTIKWINAKFEKAHYLRIVADQLSALDKPDADEQKTLAEARTKIADLERAAIDSVELICKCAKEAQLIDESLAGQRRDAKVAKKRAELAAKLSAELYGIEAAPDTSPTNSAMDAVIARAQAYQGLKSHLLQAPAE